MCQALGALIAGEASPFAATSVRRRSGGRQLRVERHSNASFTAEVQSNPGSSTAKSGARHRRGPPAPCFDRSARKWDDVPSPQKTCEAAMAKYGVVRVKPCPCLQRRALVP